MLAPRQWYLWRIFPYQTQFLYSTKTLLFGGTPQEIFLANVTGAVTIQPKLFDDTTPVISVAIYYLAHSPQFSYCSALPLLVYHQ
jgi:hypothetical protein